MSSQPAAEASARAGDKAGLRADIARHVELNFSTLVAQLYVITLDATKARELVQQAYARAWRRWATIRDLPDPEGWVRNAAVQSSHRARRARPGSSHPDGPMPPQGVESRALLDALGALDDAERRSLVLYHVVGLPVDAIANIEHVAVSAVQTQLARGHNRLLEAMSDRGDPDATAEIRLAAMYAWDERKAIALRNLVDAVAVSVVVPATAAILRKGGATHTVTAAAAIAVVTVGALGGVTLAVQAVSAAGSGPSETASVVTTPPAAPVLVTPNLTTSPQPAPRPRVARPPVTRTTTSTETTSEETSESEPSSETTSSEEASGG